ncbi:MAG: PocR ligand-binding domain-containing protein [Anaerolineae bacterium]|jgi:excisionase family DNA binding protein
MSEIDTLLTARQLQDLLQVDRITIYRMLKDGRLQGFKVGGQWRFSRQAIELWLQGQQASLDVSEAPTKAEDLQPSPEALPLACIQAIQDIFAEALGVGTVTTAVDGNPITPVANSCEFCNLVLDTEAGRQRCISSWRAAATVGGDTPMLATCHAGLHYVWGRIEVQGQFVAATHAGQFLATPPDGAAWSAGIAELSAATGVGSSRLHRALASVPVLDEARRRQVPRLLHRVAATFSEIGEERLSLLGRLQRIAEISSV